MWARFKMPPSSQRQLNFDLNEMEVSIYKYSQDAGLCELEGTLTAFYKCRVNNVSESALGTAMNGALRVSVLLHVTSASLAIPSGRCASSQRNPVIGEHCLRFLGR